MDVLITLSLSIAFATACFASLVAFKGMRKDHLITFGPAPTPSAPIPAKAAARKPETRVHDSLHLVDVLESLDVAFNAIKRVDSSLALTHREVRDGLKQIGPYVPPPDFLVSPYVLDRTSSAEPWPSMIFVGTNLDSTRAPKGQVNTDFLYAIKVKRPNWRIHAPKDVAAFYEFGISAHDDAPPNRFRRHAGHLLWAFSYIAVTTTGEVVPVRSLDTECISLRSGGAISRRKWTYGFFDEGRGTADKLRERFVLTYNLWATRRNKWIVSAKRDGFRMSFGVEQSETARFFKQRDRTIMVNGRIRPIIHHVNEHMRRVGDGYTVIKEHLRGVRTFDWKGYTCAVTAPDFHAFSADRFDTSAEFAPDGVNIPDRSLTMSQVGQLIASAEDLQVKPRLP